MTETLKLVQITHNRCDEYDGMDFMLVPESWSDDRIEDEVGEVITEMITDAKTILHAPERPTPSPKYDAYPDRTVSEVQTIWAGQQHEWAEWLAENKALTRTFRTRLQERGFVALTDNSSPAIPVEAWWGHNHGLDLKYQPVIPAL